MRDTKKEPKAKSACGVYREPKRQLDPVVYALRKRRYELQIPLNDLAKKIGYDRHNLACWECGIRTPSYRSLHDWCEALGAKLTINIVDEHSP